MLWTAKVDGRGRVQVLAKAQASVSAGCDTSILGAVATGDIDNPNVVSCTVTASGVDDNIEEDAIAYAIQEAKAYACDGLAIAKAEGAARVRPRSHPRTVPGRCWCLELSLHPPPRFPTTIPSYCCVHGSGRNVPSAPLMQLPRHACRVRSQISTMHAPAP